MAKRQPVGPLFGERRVAQEILSPFDELCGVEIQVATYRKKLRGKIEARLHDNRGRLKGISEQELEGVRDNSRLLFWFSPQANSRGRRYRVEFSAPRLSESEPVTAWMDVPDREDDFRLRCFYNQEMVKGGLTRRAFFAGIGDGRKRLARTVTDVRVIHGAFSDALVRQQSESRRERWMAQVAISPRDRLLEVGCGFGELSLAWAQRGARFLGLEANSCMRWWARRRLAGLSHTDVREQSLEVLNRLEDCSFDVAIFRPSMIDGGETERFRWICALKRVLTSAGLLLVDTADLRLITGWKRAMGLDSSERSWRTIEGPGLTKRLGAQLHCGGFAVESMRGQNGHFELVCYSRDLYNSPISKFSPPELSPHRLNAERS